MEPPFQLRYESFPRARRRYYKASVYNLAERFPSRCTAARFIHAPSSDYSLVSRPDPVSIYRRVLIHHQGDRR